MHAISKKFATGVWWVPACDDNDGSKYAPTQITSDKRWCSEDNGAVIPNTLQWIEDESIDCLDERGKFLI